jgi:pyruvate-formate lyase
LKESPHENTGTKNRIDRLKMDQRAFQDTLMNMKYGPSALKTTEDMKVLSDLMQTCLTMGGEQIQFSLVNRQTLEGRQQKPERHGDLMVRVTAYGPVLFSWGRRGRKKS